MWSYVFCLKKQHNTIVETEPWTKGSPISQKKSNALTSTPPHLYAYAYKDQGKIKCVIKTTAYQVTYWSGQPTNCRWDTTSTSSL